MHDHGTTPHPRPENVKGLSTNFLFLVHFVEVNKTICAVNLAPPVGVVNLAPPVGVVNLAPPVGVVNLAPPVGVPH